MPMGTPTSIRFQKLCNQAELILLAETMADCGHKMAVMKKVVNMLCDDAWDEMRDIVLFYVLIDVYFYISLDKHCLLWWKVTLAYPCLNIFGFHPKQKTKDLAVCWSIALAVSIFYAVCAKLYFGNSKKWSARGTAKITGWSMWQHFLNCPNLIRH